MPSPEALWELLVKPSGGQPGNNDLRAFPCEFMRDGLTDARGRASHDCHLAFQSTCHDSLPWLLPPCRELNELKQLMFHSVGGACCTQDAGTPFKVPPLKSTEPHKLCGSGNPTGAFDKTPIEPDE
ncbi:hypothetical protein ACVWXO_005463 [Bradyrhizobium sp. LM2.7]